MRRTRQLAVATIVAIVAAAIAGWVAGTRIQSPAEAAAQTAAPEPSPILVPVEERELSTDVVTRGTGRFGSPQALMLAPSALKSEAGVATSLPELGAQMAEGDLLLTVSGRPVFIFQGNVPSFRDVGPGVRGEDVRQLEAALARLGLDPGPADGLFDEATGEAMTEWYRSKGFEPVIATDEQLAEIRSSETSLIAEATAVGGVQVPADEVVFAPSFPLRVSELPVPIGATVDGPVVLVTDAAVAVDGSLPIESAGLVTEGMTVLIDEPDLGIEATGVVGFVAEGPGTNDLDGFHVYFEVVVDEAPANLVNASVRLTIPTESTSGPVLAVPISALSLGPDGSSRVQRRAGDSLEYVAVEPGLSAKGYVAVAPIEGTLQPGDLVVVGFDRQAS